MKYLAIDTSGKNLIVIAKNGDKEEIFFDPDCGLNHSVTLMDAVEQTAQKIQLDLSSVDFFSCTLGAGSFTGIRIGVSTIKALCFAYKKLFTSFRGRVSVCIVSKHLINKRRV